MLAMTWIEVSLAQTITGLTNLPISSRKTIWKMRTSGRDIKRRWRWLVHGRGVMLAVRKPLVSIRMLWMIWRPYLAMGRTMTGLWPWKTRQRREKLEITI